MAPREILLVVVVAAGVAGVIFGLLLQGMAHRRGHDRAPWFVLGFLFGPLALLLLWLMAGRRTSSSRETHVAGGGA